MKLSTRLALATALAAGALLLAQEADSQHAFRNEGPPPMLQLRKATPFEVNSGLIPPPGVYSGPMFKLSHAWPGAPPPLTNAPWRAAIHDGLITPQNAGAYTDALKAAVADNARNLILHYDSWDAAKAGWYNEPWLGLLREPIHGTYEAGDFGPDTFPGTGLRAKFNTHVITYYDARAAYSLRRFWGAQAMKPNLDTRSAQFEEGSIIVKAAVFASLDTSKPPLGWWDAMNGAQTWPMYYVVGKEATPRLWSGYVAQFDIIVKDSHSAPKTGWVFTTLVYDASAPGDAWDKMVPLGAEWGNDPQATSEGMPLQENWVNPKAPPYSTQTLGWGGRLSGPNDGARNDIAYNGAGVKNAGDSGCMSCHSTSQWNPTQQKMVTFLLPSFPSKQPPGFQFCGADGKPNPDGDFICSPPPGSAEWMKWFQNRLGTEAMDKGSFGTDFDEVFSFKSLKIWWAATGPAGQPMPLLMRQPGAARQYNLYSGAPLHD